MVRQNIMVRSRGDSGTCGEEGKKERERERERERKRDNDDEDKVYLPWTCS
jgi:hypothetical protein